MFGIRCILSHMKTRNIVEMDMPTKWGSFRLYVWEGERGRELVALSTPTLDPTRELVVRIHSECLTGDTFYSLTCDCGAQKDAALQRIQESGNGVFIYHRQEGRNVGLFKKIQSYNLMQQGFDTHDALLSVVGHPDPREYSDVLTVLQTLLKERNSKLRLLTNNPYKTLFLQRHGYEVISEALRFGTSIHNTEYAETKERKFLHNAVGYGPYASVTLDRTDIGNHLDEVDSILRAIRPLDGGRKLFVGVGLYAERGDFKDSGVLDELGVLYSSLSQIQNAHIVLHMDYPAKRTLQRDLERFLRKLSFPYSLQFRLPRSAAIGTRVDVDLLDSLHAEHVIFQLKEDHFYLLEQKSFVEYFSSPNKFVLLDESWATGEREDIEKKKARILKLIAAGLSRIAVAGGYNAENALEIHELEDYFKLPISIDAESRLRTAGAINSEKARAYLSNFFHFTR